MLRNLTIIVLTFFFGFASPGVRAQEDGRDRDQEDWDRTREIMACAPRLVDRRDLVQDEFEHSYVTNNPRDIEVGYFSVEPITYAEEGMRFCEARLPASGVSETYFRASFVSTYTLPGDGVYDLSLTSRALVFNNAPRIINGQLTIATVEAIHRLELHMDGAESLDPEDTGFLEEESYTWEIEVDDDGSWHGEIIPGKDFSLSDGRVPSGYSRLRLENRVRGGGRVSIRESVIFKMSSVSAFKYDPILQAVCLFSLNPLEISTRLRPCE